MVADVGDVHVIGAVTRDPGRPFELAVSMAPPAELVEVVPIRAGNADTYTFYVKLFESDGTIHHVEPVLRIDGHVHRIEKSLLRQRDKADGVAVLIGGLCVHLYLHELRVSRPAGAAGRLVLPGCLPPCLVYTAPPWPRPPSPRPLPLKERGLR